MRVMIALVLVSALAACSERTQPAIHPMKEGEPMTPSAAAAVRTGIPPIDAAVPARLETATFALG